MESPTSPTQTVDQHEPLVLGKLDVRADTEEIKNIHGVIENAREKVKEDLINLRNIVSDIKTRFRRVNASLRRFEREHHQESDPENLSKKWSELHKVTLLRDLAAVSHN